MGASGAVVSPLVIEQVPLWSIESATPVRVTDSQSFGFDTVIVPVTFQPESVKPVSLTVTVYVAVPPASRSVLATYLQRRNAVTARCG